MDILTLNKNGIELDDLHAGWSDQGAWRATGT